MIRHLKSKQKHGCDYCRDAGDKVPAKWRATWFTKCACEEHKADLEQFENQQEAANSYQTEAEYQLGV